MIEIFRNIGKSTYWHIIMDPSRKIIIISVVVNNSIDEAIASLEEYSKGVRKKKADSPKGNESISPIIIGRIIDTEREIILTRNICLHTLVNKRRDSLFQAVTMERVLNAGDDLWHIVATTSG